jgi:hypothetical protein
MAARQLIIDEIKRLSAAAGTVPGVRAFENETGIGQSQWRGVYWARWSDALAEAGFRGNPFQARLDSQGLLARVAGLARQLQRVPTVAEMKLAKRADPSFPNEKTVRSHCGNDTLPSVLRQFAATNPAYADIVAFLPEAEADVSLEPSAKPLEGWVYLLKSGAHYKIGRSDTVERRVKQISISLPEAVTLLHAIRTDDPAGIEAYWHRRFADRRANGEWFRLDRADLAAFQRRKFQ